jgi:MFS family permease
VILGVFAASANPDRVFGLFFVSVHVLGAAVVPLTGMLVGTHGAIGAYQMLSALSLVTFVAAARVPSPTLVVEQQTAARVLLSPSAIATLIGVLLFWTGTGAVWAFVERVGVSHGLSHTAVNNVIGVGQLAALGGALAASAVSLRFGRLFPLASAIVICVLTAGLMAYSPTFVGFGAAVLTFNFMVLLFHTFASGAMATLDPSGRVVVLGNISLTVGLGLGPSIGGLLASVGNFNSVLWLSIVCQLGALAILVPLLLRAVRPASVASAGTAASLADI